VRTVRAWLRQTYPRGEGERGPWVLDEAQAARARAELRGRTVRAAPRPPAPLPFPPAPPPPVDPALVARLLTARRARRHRRRPARRAVAGSLALLALLLALGAAGLVGAGAAEVQRLTNDCSLSAYQAHEPPRTSFVYAADGTPLGAIPASRHREPVELSEMGHWLPAATVAVKDRRFWEHGALDYQGILRAAVENLRAGRAVQGGSTITVQLVRNLYTGTSRARTLQVKIEEACLATKLAERWSKQRILEAYLNLVYYGHRAYGAEAAARTYFGKPARELTLREAALLAGLPQAPSLYDPMLHPEAARARRDEVLAALRENGDISQREYERAVARPLGLRPSGRYDRLRGGAFVTEVRRQLAVRFGSRVVRGGGLRVHTTYEPRLERLALAAIRDHLLLRTDPAAALVAIDPRTGAVRALASYAPGSPRLDFNLATQGHRQAGSAFKPFTLAAALEQGISLDSVWSGPSQILIPDERCDNGTEHWNPHNYADESGGTMTLAAAIAHSVNTIFAQLVVEVGPDRVAELAHRAGIRSPLQPVCSITLGSQAVTPYEMASAYATFAARGVYHRPSVVELVTSPSGKVLERTDTEGRRALPQNVADALTSALQGVVRNGTGTAAALDRPVAGKTGTAENYVDAWFCGYTPQLATCVWVGYPRGEIPLLNVEGFPAVFGGSLPAMIWHDFMAAALERDPVLEFARPDLSQFEITPHGRAEPAATTAPETKKRPPKPQGTQATPPPPAAAPPPATEPPPSTQPGTTVDNPPPPPQTEPPPA
jgi:penicillin-binding protein 1A